MEKLVNKLKSAIMPIWLILGIVSCISAGVYFNRARPITIVQASNEAIIIESTVDTITVYKVVINRGYCISPYPPSDGIKPIHFGQQIRIPITNCNVRELLILTDDSVYKYIFKEPPTL